MSDGNSRTCRKERRWLAYSPFTRCIYIYCDSGKSFSVPVQISAVGTTGLASCWHFHTLGISFRGDGEGGSSHDPFTANRRCLATTEPLVWDCHSRTYIHPRMR